MMKIKKVLRLKKASILGLYHHPKNI